MAFCAYYNLYLQTSAQKFLHFTFSLSSALLGTNSDYFLIITYIVTERYIEALHISVGLSSVELNSILIGPQGLEATLSSAWVRHIY